MTKPAPTAKDKDLLQLLQANARAPVAELARKLGLSRTTVQDRLRRLEEQGVIAGYGLRLAKAAEAGLSAWVSVSVEARQQLAVAKALSHMQGIELLQAVSGKVDFVALVTAPTAGEMDQVLDAITLLPGVTAIETAVILSTKLDRRTLPS
ncbi:MAG: Lrp/AsnC family transcriptional regulator [Alphaproteobacteria bacterium]|nr:Lrp/AsnC family transcriptional regulator [Alphaproteobacteria bacterium]